MEFSVALVTHAATGGGAGIACARLHKALQANGVASQLLTATSWPGAKPSTLNRLRIQSLGVRQLEKRILLLQKTPNAVHHSLGYLSSGYGSMLRHHEADIVHLHWINNGLLSLRDTVTVGKPTVWTLHDMWAFCGAEHYPGSFNDDRYVNGYGPKSRPASETGFALNEWTWKRKIAHKLSDIVYVAPSRWMAQQAARSVVLQDARIEVIANGLETDFWTPCASSGEIRSRVGIAPDERVVLFASAAGYKEWRKGHDLFGRSMEELAQSYSGRICIVNLGGSLTERASSKERVRLKGTGFLGSQEQIRDWYRVADVVVIPSRLDNFPNVALEAMACGVPCCAFDSGGVSEAIVDGLTGYVVAKEDTEALAAAVGRLLADRELHRQFALASRERATDRYSLDAFAQAHSALYADMLRAGTPKRRV